MTAMSETCRCGSTVAVKTGAIDHPNRALLLFQAAWREHLTRCPALAVSVEAVGGEQR